MKARLSPRFESPTHCQGCRAQISPIRQLAGCTLCKSCAVTRLLDPPLQADRTKPPYKSSKNL